MRLSPTITIGVLLLSGCLSARAQIGLLLDAKPNVQMELGNALTGAGHSGVYLARVCPAGPVQLRLCQPGELGSVIQNYQDYKEDAPYEWNVVPLNVYLYGVDDLQQRPLFGSPKLRELLQEQYRQKYLQDVCTTERCISGANADWREAVAAAFVREIYIFEVDTTPEQDERFVREFNARVNVNHYSGFKRNCADFAKLVVDTYFPHSAHRDVLNDLGITGPKAIARSFTHYAEHHPELQLRVVRIEQVPGTYKRSSDCHEGTEQLLRSKKWLVPIMVVGYDAVPVIAASYLLTGRFSPDHELRKHPSDRVAVLNQELATAKQEGDPDSEHQVGKELQNERERQVGDSHQWEMYRERFEEVLRTAIADGVISNRHALRTVFRDFQARGRVYLDNRQQAWMEVESDGQLRRIGLSAGNILSSETDPQLRFRLLLARTQDLLWVNPKHRELYSEFEADWALLQQAEQLTHSRPAAGIIAARQ